MNVDLPWTAYLPRDYVHGPAAAHRGVSPAGAACAGSDRLDDFRQELRDRFGPLPEPAEWLLRLAELRLLAAHWKVASIHLEKPAEGGSGPTDVVLGYRNPRRIQELAARSDGRLRVVDDASAYFRPTGEELEPLALYETLRDLLRPLAATGPNRAATVRERE